MGKVKIGTKYRVNRRRQPYTKFKAWMQENGIRQDELAEIIGKSRNVVNQKLNGTGGDFTMEEVRKICQYFKISADTFFIIQKVS